MKDELLALIGQIDNIRTKFHITENAYVPKTNVIFDNSEFSAWKQAVQFELEEIYAQTKDKYIWTTLVLLKQGFNGWNDEHSFNDLSGSLLAIQKNIQKYFPNEIIDSKELPV